MGAGEGVSELVFNGDRISVLEDGGGGTELYTQKKEWLGW